MPQITDISQLDVNATYSYADYLTWQFADVVELIKGKVLAMSPAPSAEHQGLSRNLLLVIGNYLYKKPCAVFYAPFDVRLYDRKKSMVANQDIFSVVQPDLCVICDKSKIDTQGCLGSPDWIIEILSPGNSKTDMQQKYQLYQESGVTEYWLVYPGEKAVHQFVLNELTGSYQLLNMYACEDLATPIVFPDLQVDLRVVFDLE